MDLLLKKKKKNVKKKDGIWTTLALKKEEIKVKTLKKNTEYVSVFTTFISYKIARMENS